MKFTIPDVVFTVIYGAIMAAITLIMALTKLQQENEKKIFKKFTLYGWLTLSMLIVGIIVTVLQSKNNENRDFNNEKQDKADQHERDSIGAIRIKEGIEEGNQILFGQIAEAFQSQNLVIEKLNIKVGVLNDTISTIKINKPNPILHFRNDAIQIINNDSIKNKITLKMYSLKESITNFNLIFYTLIEYEDGKKNINKHDDLLPKTTVLPEGTPKSIGFTYDSDVLPKNLFIYVKGQYSNMDGSIKLPIDVVLFYNAKTKETTEATRFLRVDILNQIEKEFELN